jgi:hypothetical protein
VLLRGQTPLHSKNKMYLTNIYIVFHPAVPIYILFSAAHGTFSKTDYILGHKIIFIKHKEYEIIPCIPTDYNGIKLKIYSKENH